MPLKPRNGTSRVLSNPAPTQVTSRERPVAGPTAEELVAKANAVDPSVDEDEDAGLDTAGDTGTPVDITDDGEEDAPTTGAEAAVGADPGIEVGATTHTPAPRRAGRPPRAAAASVDPAADPKPRMSEIQREVKALRSEYTAEVKRVEAEYGERLRALRSEYDLLNNQVVEQTFTL